LAISERIDRHLTLWLSTNLLGWGSKGSCFIPSGFRLTEADAAKTAFLQAWALHMLWRGHAFQGRYQPGRRAVLEETDVMSDRKQYTCTALCFQAKCIQEKQTKGFIYFNLRWIGGLR
jgi:hypothetical protein